MLTLKLQYDYLSTIVQDYFKTAQIITKKTANRLLKRLFNDKSKTASGMIQDGSMTSTGQPYD